ncbi:MAG TPA: serine hydrolase [Thermoleophilaceae bacterium]|nr:serine hydrolase [Thermoleophilaceae bacterium]
MRRVPFIAVAAVAALPALPGTSQMGVYPGLRPLADLAGPAPAQTDSGVGVYPALTSPDALVFPGPAALRSAARYAASRHGKVAFAVADDRGAVAGVGVDRRFPSASLSKAMLLVAFLRRADSRGTPPTAAERESLGYMIRLSDNASADAIYRKVGDGGMRALARAAGMRHFSIDGSWAGARITAADQARFFLRLDDLTPPRHRGLERDVLETVSPLQTWGIPRAARPRWRTYFKGGWRPEGGTMLEHQAAYLERGRHRVAMAILTEGGTDARFGRATQAGIARRLLAGTDGPLLTIAR